MNKRLSIIFLSFVLTLSVFFTATSLVAQAQEETQESQETTEVVRAGQVSTVWRVIQIASLVLAIISAIGLTYGIVQWRKGVNTNDLFLIERGRRITIIFGILLAVFLILLLISFLVIRRQQQIPDIGEPTGVAVGVSGLETRDILLIVEAQPIGYVQLRNVALQILFNQDVSLTSIEEFIEVRKDGTEEPVVGTWELRNTLAVFRPNQICPSPNEDLHCFDADSTYVVTINKDITSLDGDEFRCGSNQEECSFNFTTGNAVDAEPPTVSMTLPFDGEGVSVDSKVLVEALARDVFGIGSIEFFADDQSFGVAMVEGGMVLTEFRGSSVWDTIGQLVNSSHELYARALDLAGLESISIPITVDLLPLHCFDLEQDEDETGIDCGGASCRSCTGSACTENAQCASGLCFEGTCQDFPVIEEIIDSNGAPGNVVTIRGKNFGNIPGKIIFEGDPNDPTDDVEVPFGEGCGSWLDDQIIFTIPQGAPSGNIRVETSEGLYDTTSNQTGTTTEFEVNEIVRPGICSITPNEQEAGLAVRIVGVHFGTEISDILFSNVSATDIEGWSDTSINSVTVPQGDTGRIPVRVFVDGESSNPVYMTVRSSSVLPRLISVNPDRGPIGQMFSVIGENLGGNPLVKFLDPRTGEVTLADSDLPASCLAVQSDTQRAYRVPRLDPGAYELFAETDKGKSNSLDFTVTLGQRVPGLCGLEPDNGPIGIPVTLYGEGFGSQNGQVRFTPRIDDSPISAWSDATVQTSVPPTAQTGSVQVISSEGELSNPLQFKVGQCSPDTCSEGYECCTNGACQRAGTCENVAAMCTYTWTFTTGDTIGGAPRVIEQAQCRASTQSPSPYLSTNDACVNSMVSARFTHDMNEATFNNNNVVLTRCNTGGTLQQNACSTQINLSDFSILNEGQTGEGFQAIPQTRLLPDTWYEVELSTGILSSNGAGLENPYNWFFKTQTGDQNCSVNRVEVSPSATTIRQLGDEQDFTGSALALNCNILNDSVYQWSWQSQDTSKATISFSTNNSTTATARGATEPGPAVKIFGSIPEFNKSDWGELSVILQSPTVITQWPTCSSACSNASLGARFDQDMQENSVINETNVKLFECTDATCTRDGLQEVGVTQLRYDALERELHFQPVSGDLKSGANYRVALQNMYSENGLRLAGLNYDLDNTSGVDSYSWLFTVRENQDRCLIDTVRVTPNTVNAQLIGQEFDYFALPISSPDQCSSTGQILQPNDYEWSWFSSQENVATITNDDFAEPVSFIDPYQVAEGVGSGTSQIQATTLGRSGDGVFNLQCGYQEDQQCPSPATVDTYAVGTDSCCHPRPTIRSTNPIDGAQAICTTLAVEVAFDQAMDTSSFNGNILLEYNNGAAACPGSNQAGIWPSIKKFASNIWEFIIPSINAQSENWCQSSANISSFSSLEGTIARVTPQNPLQKNVQYRVRVTDGVRNNFGVNMNDEFTSSFVTKDAECSLDIVDVIINPPGEQGVRDIFFCAVRNDCAGDYNPQAEGNQHGYQAIGRDLSGAVVPAEYSWTVGGSIGVEINDPNSELVEVTTNAQNGFGFVTVRADAIAPSRGSVTRSVDIRVFICENPWPSILNFPYSDQLFNYSLFYCRDAGEQGFADDLPPLSVPVIESEIPGVLRESIFIIE